MLTNPMEIRLKGTKSVIKFANLNTAEDYGKVKSIKFPGGYCRFIWFEEADQFQSKHDVDQVLLSLYRGGDVFETIFTYNTPFSPSHWLNIGWRNEREMGTEGSELKEKVYFKHVNLYDIPKGIIPQQTYDMAEAMREDNLQEWKHVIMGETGDPATMVFSNVKAMREQDLDWDAKENWHLARESNWKVCLGIDYGYAPDITAFTVSIYNRLAKVLWVIDECGGARWSEEGIYEHVKEVLNRRGGGIGKRLSLNITPSSIINSEIDNRIIDGLRRTGLNVYPVKKGNGSRDVSYQFLTGGYGDLKELWVDSEQCPGTWAEMIGAEFPRRDINGKEVIIQEWPNVNDHFL